MLILGLIAAAVVIIYKRATEIVTIRPLDGLKTASDTPDFASVIGAISQAAQQAAAEANKQQNRGRRERQGAPQVQAKSERGRAAIRAMVANDQFHEAIELYKRVYGVDSEAAKKAVDEMMLQ